MNEMVTVDKAITRGHRMVNYPVFVIMIGTLSVSFFLGSQGSFPLWIFPLGFGLAFGLAWLYWSIMITKWRIWAFENVRNVHELKKRAIQEKLIWPDGSVFEKTEIRSSATKEKWESLKSKFNREDQFFDDVSVPAQTIIYYSKGKNFFEMIFMLICLGAGIYLLLTTDNYIIGLGMSLVGAYLSYREFREVTNREPQIILSDDGIQTISTEFYRWEDIDDEESVSEGSGKNIHFYLKYNFPEGTEHLLIDDYDINMKSLNKLLILYRGRNKRKRF